MTSPPHRKKTEPTAPAGRLLRVCFSPMNTLRRSLAFALLGLCLAGGAAADGDNVRFSKTLAPEEFTAIELDRLSSDELAILDALVRRDIAQASRFSKKSRAAKFSERLTDDEKQNAGFATLSLAAIEQLDARIEQVINPPADENGRTFSASSSATGPYSVPSVKLRREPEIHGELTLMVTAGSGGYSAYGGGIALSYYDPANKFSVGVSYSQVRSKGGYGYYRDCWRDDPFRRPYVYDPLDPFARW